jgi:hypothetical protein
MMSLAYIKMRAAAPLVVADDLVLAEDLVSPAAEESAVPPVEEEERIAAIVQIKGGAGSPASKIHVPLTETAARGRARTAENLIIQTPRVFRAF